MQSKYIISNSDLKKLNDSLSQITSSLNNLSEVCKNIIPEELSNNGLKSTLEKLFKTIQLDKQVELTTLFEGAFIRLSPNLESIIYYVCNALLTFYVAQSKSKKLTLVVLQNHEYFVFRIAENSPTFSFEAINQDAQNEWYLLNTLILSANGVLNIKKSQEFFNFIEVKMQL